MAKVLGVGGVFFRTKDPAATQKWYVDNLGISPDNDGYVVFETRRRNEDIDESVVWSPCKTETEYFGDSGQEFMVNYVVDDLDGMREQLKAAGIEVLEKVEEMEGLGKFGWAVDPDGRRIELWEPERGER